MKTLLTLSALLALAPSFASANLFPSSMLGEPTTDGCYQMYKPGSLFPVICVSGSAEEGIGGAGARVVLVGPNSDQVVWCGKTTKIRSTKFGNELNALKYFFATSSGMESIEFDGKIGNSGQDEGKVTLIESTGGKNTLDYMKLEARQAAGLLKAFSSSKCKAAGI